MTAKQSQGYFFRLEKENDNIHSWLLDFEWAVYVIRLFDSHFSSVYFSGIKCILARQMRHNTDKVIIIEIDAQSNYNFGECLDQNAPGLFQSLLSSSERSLFIGLFSWKRPSHSSKRPCNSP